MFDIFKVNNSITNIENLPTIDWGLLLLLSCLGIDLCFSNLRNSKDKNAQKSLYLWYLEGHQANL